MMGFKLNNEQKDLLVGQEFAPNQYFNPVTDVHGDYFIFEGEVNGCVHPEFMWVKELPQAEYVLPTQNSIE